MQKGTFQTIVYHIMGLKLLMHEVFVSIMLKFIF